MRMCFSCREQIDGPAIASEGNFYHPDHFCCDRCKQPVGIGFQVYKVWRLCHSCVPRPLCSSVHCSQPDKRIGHSSGTFYRMPVDTRLEAFHSCHTVRCSICGRGIFWCGSPADSLAYHLNDGRHTCTRCYYHIDTFNRWQNIPGSRRGRPMAREDASRRLRPPLPNEFVSNRPQEEAAKKAPPPAKSGKAKKQPGERDRPTDKSGDADDSGGGKKRAGKGDRKLAKKSKGKWAPKETDQSKPAPPSPREPTKEPEQSPSPSPSGPDKSAKAAPTPSTSGGSKSATSSKGKGGKKR